MHNRAVAGSWGFLGKPVHRKCARPLIVGGPLVSKPNRESEGERKNQQPTQQERNKKEQEDTKKNNQKEGYKNEKRTPKGNTLIGSWKWQFLEKPVHSSWARRLIVGGAFGVQAEQRESEGKRKNQHPTQQEGKIKWKMRTQRKATRQKGRKKEKRRPKESTVVVV